MCHYDSVIEDLCALYEVGHRIASGDTRPQWKDGSEFKAAGDALRKASAP